MNRSVAILAAVAVIAVMVVSAKLAMDFNANENTVNINSLGTVTIKVGGISSTDPRAQTVNAGDILSASDGCLWALFSKPYDADLTCHLFVANKETSEGAWFSNPADKSTGWTFVGLTIPDGLNIAFFEFHGWYSEDREIVGNSISFKLQGAEPANPVIIGPTNQTLATPVSLETLTWNVAYTGGDIATYEIWMNNWMRSSGTFHAGQAMSFQFDQTSIGFYIISFDFHCAKGVFKDYVSIDIAAPASTTTTTTTTVPTTTTTTTTGTETGTTTPTTTGTIPTTTPDIITQNLGLIMVAVVVAIIVVLVIVRK